MFKKSLSFSNLTLLVALSLSTVAAYYSIIGLTAIFAGAVIPVIIMGSILEVGKITATVWLRKYWDRAGLVIKLYLVPAVVALALLTSMGIFGFLSKAHMDSGIATGDVSAKVALLDEKIKTERDNIELARKALAQMDAQVDQRLSRSDSENAAERAVAIRKQQQKERTQLQKDIGDAQKNIAALNEERAPIASELRKVEAEVGPIKYIAALIYGDNTDQNMLEGAVRWMIILLVLVFDPLAIALVLAANQSKEWDKEEPQEENTPDPYVPDVGEKPTTEELKNYEPDDGPLTEDQINQIKESVKDNTPDIEEGNRLIDEIEKEVPEVIIPDEPMKFDDPGEHPKDYDETQVEEPVVEVKEEKSIFEQHPYLLKGFDHFKNTEPLVYKPEVKEELVEEKPKKKRVRKPKVVEAVVEFTDVERPGDYIIPPDNIVQVMPKKPYNEIDGTYVTYKGKHMNKDVLKNEHPELFTLKADAEFNTPISTSFGIKFPENAKKGDIFVRVDMLPNRVYKQDGNGRWIEVNKNNSDTYLHNQKYIEHLVDMLDKGQYDPELLSDSEREQIERHIKRARKS